MKSLFRNLFHRPARRGRGAVYESRDLQDDQLDLISGGIPDFPRHESQENALRIELPFLTPRPSDNPDLWF